MPACHDRGIARRGNGLSLHPPGAPCGPLPKEVQLKPGSYVGVYQKLSTRADGEVVSSDSY
jgi:hypothetical protein